MNIFLIKTEKEKEINIGAQYPYEKLGSGECLIHSYQQKNLNISKGDIAKMVLYIVDLYSTFINKYNVYAVT